MDLDPSLPASSFAHIFEDEPETPWPKLDADRYFSRLHAKWWGRDIREDQRQWQAKQTMYQSMDTDQNNVLPANFAFLFNINDEKSNMWVREEYVLLYDYCTAHFNQSSLYKSRSIVLTGQPGIGKSYWIYYAARRRLGEKEPLIWYYGLEWYLFVEDGVFRCPGRFASTRFRRVGLWVLVDSDHSPDGSPPDVVQVAGKLHIIFTSSPRESRWKALKKTTSCTTVIMNPWSWEEIYRAAIAHKLTDGEIDLARGAFDELGPTARLCIDFVQNPGQLASYESHRETELADLSMSDLKKAVKDWSTLKSSVFPSIFLVRREELPPSHERYLQRYTIEPITAQISQKFKYKLMEAKQEQRLDIYETFEPVRQVRRLARLAFEMIGHRRFQKEVELTLIPMAKDPNPRRGLTVWQSQFLGESEPMGSVGAIPISFKPQDITQYQWPGPNVVGSSIYYVPESSNQVAFDSFVVDDRVLYIFQFTIATSHQIRAGIMDFLSQQSLRTTLQGEEWRFIFIIPPGHMVECPEASDNRLEEFWKKVELYSAVIDPKKEG